MFNKRYVKKQIKDKSQEQLNQLLELYLDAYKTSDASLHPYLKVWISTITRRLNKLHKKELKKLKDLL